VCPSCQACQLQHLFWYDNACHREPPARGVIIEPCPSACSGNSCRECQTRGSSCRWNPTPPRFTGDVGGSCVVEQDPSSIRPCAVTR
jgi:hypothetical protein